MRYDDNLKTVVVAYCTVVFSRMSATTANLYRMVSIAEAQETVLKAISPLPVISVGLLDAVGYVLGEEIIAREPLPPFPASIKVS